MAEWIMKEETDMDGVDCYIRKGELIRCKDCKHWRANTQFCSVFSGICTVQRMPPDGFCSEAERKEDA